MSWEPTPNSTVVVFPGTEYEATGTIVEDFGDFTALGVEVNNTHISAPARRWAVVTSDGSLAFVDTEHLAPRTETGASAQPDA